MHGADRNKIRENVLTMISDNNDKEVIELEEAVPDFNVNRNERKILPNNSGLLNPSLSMYLNDSNTG